MPNCERCGESKKNTKIRLYQFPKEYGGTKFLCQKCYEIISKNINKNFSKQIEKTICSHCHTPIYASLQKCPYCHYDVQVNGKITHEQKLRDKHMIPWNHNKNHIPDESKKLIECSTFTIKKPILIFVSSIFLVSILLLTILYLPAIADTDDEQFIGTWSGSLGMVYRTTWEFEDDHILEITIDREKKTTETYQWIIDDSHIRFKNLPEDNEDFTEINLSKIQFLRYTIPFCYDFNLKENVLTLGMDNIDFSVEFTKQ